MDILQFLQDFSTPHTTKGKNVGRGWIAIHCPYCNDNGFHGGFPLKGTHYYCWRCGGHNLDKTLQILSGLSYYEYSNIKESYDGTDSIIYQLNEVKKQDSITLPGIPLIKYDRNYLRKRGFNPTYLESKYGLQSGGVFGEWAYRIIIPIKYQDKLVSWQGRDTTMDSDKIRYKTLPIDKSVMDAKSVLFNYDNCAGDSIIVVEGPFGAMRWGDGCCATLGTSTTENQVRLLTKKKKVFIIFDSEYEAQERARKLAKRVAAFGTKVEVVDLELPEDVDPGDLTDDEVKKYKKELGFLF